MRTGKLFLVLALTLLPACLAHAQAVSTASRKADLQVGVDFSIADPNYANDVYQLAQPTSGDLHWHGYGVYANLDLRYHLGLEFDFHQLSGPDPVLYERTFEVGGRYLYPLRHGLVPYGKAMVGRGIFNFAALDATTGKSVQIANLGYNTQTVGGGLDLRLRPGLHVRLFDYEYQIWDNFPPNKLNPQVISFGVAYHFHGPMSLRK